MSNEKSQDNAHRRSFAPWSQVIEGRGESQPQGLLDFPPTTNLSLEVQQNLWRLIMVQLSNILFSLVTLGVYRFWGRTRLRRRIWQSVSITDSTLIYHATGLELFLSNLVSMIVLAPVGLTFYLVWTWRAPWGLEAAALLCLGGGVVLFFWLMGTYLRTRFWAVKTTWRGIRGILGGAAWQFALVGLLHGLLTLVTLGFWLPNLHMAIRGMIAQRASVGNLSLAWERTSQNLFSTWIFAWGLGIFALALGGTLMLTGPDSAAGSLPSLLLALPLGATLCMLPFALVAYDVALTKSTFASIRAGELSMFLEVSYTDVLWLRAKQFLTWFVCLVAVIILALMLLPIFGGLFDAQVELATAYLGQIAGIERLGISASTLAGLLTLASALFVTSFLRRLVEPLVRITSWLSILQRRLVFEGRLNIDDITQVRQGSYIRLGDGVAMALDAGGL